jgi:hypothetical protein
MRTSILAALTALALVASIVPTAAAAPITWFSELGYGKITNNGAPDGSIGFGVGLMYQFPTSNWGLGAEACYQNLGSVEAGTEEASFSTIPVTVQLNHMFPSAGTTSLYLGAGTGFYSTSVEVGDVDASNTDLGLNFGGGLKFGSATSTLKFGVDGKYHIIMTEGESTNMISLFGRIFFGG